MQQIIGFAGQRKAAQHLRPRLYGGGKFFACNLGLADGYADKRLKAEFDGDGGEQGGILAENRPSETDFSDGLPFYDKSP